MRILLIFIFFVTLKQVQAQESVDKVKPDNWGEFGLELVALDYFPYRIYIYGGVSVLPSVYFKKQFKRQLVRVSLLYGEADSYYRKFWYQQMERRMGLSAGYQWLWSSTRVSPFFSSDLIYTYSESKVLSDPVVFESFAPTGGISSFTSYSNLAGFNQGIGMRAVLGKNVVFSIEHQLSIFAIWTNSGRQNHYYTVDSGFRPLILSLGIKF